MAAPLCIPTKSMQAFQFSYILSKFVVFLIIAILKDIRWYLIMGLIERMKKM